MALVNSWQLGRKITVSARLKGIERNIKTGWRWTQSRAPFSTPNSLRTGKIQGIWRSQSKSFDVNSTMQSILARESSSPSAIGTGIDRGRNREPSNHRRFPSPHEWEVEALAHFSLPKPRTHYSVSTDLFRCDDAATHIRLNLDG